MKAVSLYFTDHLKGIDIKAKATKKLRNYVCRIYRLMPVNKASLFLL
jgi:hypothetical protein